MVMPDDYAVVPTPLNLRAHPVGNCLIWLHKLDAGGYGRALFAQGERLAHRQAYRQSRGFAPESDVLHLCHRPYCVQPSHLYDGEAQDNSDDRKLRVSEGLDWALFERKAAIVSRVAKYCWDARTPAGMHPLMMVPVDHECEFIIPALDRLICHTCGRDSISNSTEDDMDRELQPENADRNFANILRHTRSHRDIAGGISIQTDSWSEYSVALTRPERRRREKAARKSPFRNKPVMVHEGMVTMKPGEPTTVSHRMPEGGLFGPGILVTMISPITPVGFVPHYDSGMTSGKKAKQLPS